MQNLDMQQVVFRQLSTLQDEVLNWTSDAKELLVEALSQPAELELMQMKLHKIRQELPNYLAIQESIRAKTAKLCELNRGGGIPQSIDSLQQLVQREMDAVAEYCNQLEESVRSIHQQEDGLHKDLRDLSLKIGQLKLRLKPCEDLIAADDRLAEQFAVVKHVQVNHCLLIHSFKFNFNFFTIREQVF